MEKRGVKEERRKKKEKERKKERRERRKEKGEWDGWAAPPPEGRLAKGSGGAPWVMEREGKGSCVDGDVVVVGGGCWRWRRWS